MNRVAVLLCSSLACASAAHADFMSLFMQLSQNGVDWSTNVTAVAGQSLSVRVLATWGRDAGPGLAFAGVNVTQFTVYGSNAGDTATGFAGRIQPQSQTFSFFNAGTSGAKIDRLDNPGGQIQMFQLPPSNGGVADNPIQIFSFTYSVAAAGVPGDIVIGDPMLITLANIYSSAGGTTASVPAANRKMAVGTITVLAPAPGSAGLLCAAGLAAFRRRR